MDYRKKLVAVVKQLQQDGKTAVRNQRFVVVGGGGDDDGGNDDGGNGDHDGGGNGSSCGCGGGIGSTKLGVIIFLIQFYPPSPFPPPF